MIGDLFDKLTLAGVLVCAVAICLLLGGFIESGETVVAHGQNPAVEKAMQQRARSAFLLETYQPVEELMREARYAEALLKLQRYEKEFPGEPHTLILRASILVKQGVLHEGIDQYAAAVKINGDYVDANSSLNRRVEISELVEKAVPELKRALRATSTPTLEKALREAYYLQSRLAGGCE